MEREGRVAFTWMRSVRRERRRVVSLCSEEGDGEEGEEEGEESGVGESASVVREGRRVGNFGRSFFSFFPLVEDRRVVRVMRVVEGMMVVDVGRRGGRIVLSSSSVERREGGRGVIVCFAIPRLASGVGLNLDRWSPENGKRTWI